MYKDAAELCRDEIKKVKAQLKLDFTSGAERNRKGFCRYISRKRKVQEGAPPLVSDTDRLVTADKVKVLKNVLPVFTGNCSSHIL